MTNVASRTYPVRDPSQKNLRRRTDGTAEPSRYPVGMFKNNAGLFNSGNDPLEGV